MSISYEISLTEEQFSDCTTIDSKEKDQLLNAKNTKANSSYVISSSRFEIKGEENSFYSLYLDKCKALQRLEAFKEQIDKLSKVASTVSIELIICGMLNALGSLIIMGVVMKLKDKSPSLKNKINNTSIQTNKNFILNILHLNNKAMIKY